MLVGFHTKRRGANLSTLADEYSHIFNRTLASKGEYLSPDLAAYHVEFSKGGTAALNDVQNTLYHQLEMANMVYSGFELPSFVRAIPQQDINFFIRQAPDVMAYMEGL